jgi:phosphoserine phosphatase
MWQLEVSNDQFTGQVLGDIVDGTKKAELTLQLMKKHGISSEQVNHCSFME